MARASLLVSMLMLSGCASPWSRKSSVAEATFDPFANPEATMASVDIDDKNGIIPVGFTPSNGRADNSATAKAREASRKGIEAMIKAEELVKAGKYKEAENELDEIVKRYRLDDYGKRKRTFKNTFVSPSDRDPHYTDSPLREEALYLLGEVYYQQKKYPKAQDSYLKLVNDYPTTRYLEQSTRRLFEIAGIWMDLQVTTTGDVVPANYTNDGKASRPKVADGHQTETPSFLNLTDKERPTFDTEGRALESLKSIWLHDPTGPLADDALMLTASYQLRKGRFFEASETYKLLREEYPDSPHAKDAFLLGSHVAQASYLGSSYDSKSLAEAKQLKEASLKIFRDLPEDQRARLQAELVRIDDAIIRRDYDRAVFYLRKGDFESVTLYCSSIINQYPGSVYAEKCKQLLKQLPNYRDKNTLLLAIQGAGEFESENFVKNPGQPAAQPQAPGATAPNLQPTPVPEQELKRSNGFPNLIPPPFRRKDEGAGGVQGSPVNPGRPAETGVDLNGPPGDTPPPGSSPGSTPGQATLDLTGG
ncbi:tetratricopeptide repeat protein [Lacunimicrobium album]